MLRKGLLLGSVTRQALSLAQKMTIFVLGRETAFNPKCPISPLLFPVDGSEPSLEAVRREAALAQSFKDGEPRLTLLHVIDFVWLDTAYAEGNTLFIAVLCLPVHCRHCLSLRLVEDKKELKILLRQFTSPLITVYD